MKNVKILLYKNKRKIKNEILHLTHTFVFNYLNITSWRQVMPHIQYESINFKIILIKNFLIIYRLSVC
jgi:hypothetical protein